MATMNISLTDTMKEWVESQTNSGRYGNVSDYMRDLIRRDQDHRHAIVEALIEGENSGESSLSVSDIWQQVQQEN
ncbi:MAG: type II toxin-antitoxin system ParD family antitoxin [Candidatus Thioglobus sp.]|jgi:antitoxin ParD1/3/4|nr:type II toxin-antitoxin system ParD family antitoxin [Candidatus Thioglobus sp.]